MDYRRENGYSSNDVIQIGVSDNWGSFANDQAIWATEDDYGAWTREASMETNPNSNYDGKQPQFQSGSETPNKRSKPSQTSDLPSSNRSKAIGKMFYKTKLCCKFRVGTCPYVTNCNFAHTIEELRKPPPNWQEIVAQHEDERGISSEPREEYQIPILGISDDAQRNFKGRHCKKFYTEEGCPYGENCTFVHDEQSKTRESVAISLGPGSGGGYGNNENESNLKPSNWKTRICNKWELTGYCPFGSKCHFAHGAAELHRYGGGQLDSDYKDSSTPDGKQGTMTAKTSVDTVLASVPHLPHSDNYNMGVPLQRLSGVIPRTGRGANQKWKGPDKISKIYGDWIDDL